MDKDKPLSIEEIHEGTLEIIKKLIEICDEINVNYFVAYGSLIGAVRHKGFIPWDDDFDVIMLRPDYDKFCRYCDEHEKELYPFRLMNHKNTPDYPFTISRLNDLRYRMESVGYPDAGMGLFIDIYPYDGCGNDFTKAKKYIERRKSFYQMCLGLIYSHNFFPTNRSKLYTIPRLFVMVVAKLIGKNYFMNKLENLKNTYDYGSSEYVYCVIWDRAVCPLKKEWFMEKIETTFESLTVSIPKQYKEILTLLYGDYMQLPPKEEQKASHNYILYRQEKNSKN